MAPSVATVPPSLAEAGAGRVRIPRMTHALRLPLDQHRGGTGRPMLLLHGIGSTWRVFRPVLPALEACHDVLAIDLPGFGLSSPLPPDRPPSIETMADAAEGALDAAGLGRAHLVGNSMGGWIALELARRGRALGVVGLAPAGFWSDAEASWASAVLTAQIAGARTLLPFVDRLLARPGLRGAFFRLLVSHPERVPVEAAVESVRMLVGSSATFGPMRRSMLAHAPTGLAAISCPVLIAWGTKDRLLFLRQGARAAREIPGARLELLPGLGHLPTLDDPELTARTILRFCAEVDARATDSPGGASRDGPRG